MKLNPGFMQVVYFVRKISQNYLTITIVFERLFESVGDAKCYLALVTHMCCFLCTPPEPASEQEFLLFLRRNERALMKQEVSGQICQLFPSLHGFSTRRWWACEVFFRPSPLMTAITNAVASLYQCTCNIDKFAIIPRYCFPSM